MYLVVHMHASLKSYVACVLNRKFQYSKTYQSGRLKIRMPQQSGHLVMVPKYPFACKLNFDNQDTLGWSQFTGSTVY